MGGRFQPEWVAGLGRNARQVCSGIYTQDIKLLFKVTRHFFNSLIFKVWEGNIRELDGHIENVAIATKQHLLQLTPQLLRIIIEDPVSYIKEKVYEGEQILRKEEDWETLRVFIKNNFILTQTAEKLKRDRESVTKKINSICLRLGDHFEFDDVKVVSYLQDQGSLKNEEIEDFIKALSKRYKAVIENKKKQTKKRIHYKDEEEIVKKLIQKRPEMESS